MTQEMEGRIQIALGEKNKCRETSLMEEKPYGNKLKTRGKSRDKTISQN